MLAQLKGFVLSPEGPAVHQCTTASQTAGWLPILGNPAKVEAFLPAQALLPIQGASGVPPAWFSTQAAWFPAPVAWPSTLPASETSLSGQVATILTPDASVPCKMATLPALLPVQASTLHDCLAHLQGESYWSIQASNSSIPTRWVTSRKLNFLNSPISAQPSSGWALLTGWVTGVNFKWDLFLSGTERGANVIATQRDQWSWKTINEIIGFQWPLFMNVFS